METSILAYCFACLKMFMMTGKLIIPTILAFSKYLKVLDAFLWEEEIETERSRAFENAVSWKSRTERS